MHWIIYERVPLVYIIEKKKNWVQWDYSSIVYHFEGTEPGHADSAKTQFIEVKAVNWVQVTTMDVLHTEALHLATTPLTPLAGAHTHGQLSGCS